MPIPQENSLFVERASSPLLTLVQDVSYIDILQTVNRQPFDVVYPALRLRSGTA